MHKRRIKVGLLVVAVAAAIVVGVVLLRNGVSDPNEPVRARVKWDSVGSVSAAWFRYDGPPPYPHGNYFTIRVPAWIGLGTDYQVVNMYFENYTHIIHDLHIDEIEVLLFANRTCQIVDPRIPLEWRRGAK